ncbi:uncharacterized protein LOC114828306 [Galendromus occidentalis]|uniref:Uncharacterized protein LOC114828306 n=1 Tax=Galendromus occidentalis TaxID=34638 RepID=A0AAJ7WHX5_9ACAR|nr:uncharacterized protein LOC114828306 [Galendromus occidentalis]
MIRDIRENPRKLPMDVVIDRRRGLPIRPASQIIPQKQLRYLRHHASLMRPKTVGSLAELHGKINSDAILDYTVSRDNERLRSFFEPQANTLLLTTDRLLGSLNNISSLHADATYKTAPREICKQIFTLHANWQGHVGIIACALMNESNADAYAWVLRCLKEKASTLEVPSYMGDWDLAIRAAVHSEFPQATLHGCWFHYSQCLVRRAGGMGLATAIRRPGLVLSRFLSFLALPLLPAPLIVSTFEYFSEQARLSHAGFSKFLKYVESHWLNTVGPGNLSVHGLVQRTNNDVESHNAKLLRQARRSHGTVWNIISVLMGLLQDAAVDRVSHEIGDTNLLSKPSRATKDNRMILEHSWGLLDSGEIDGIEFINRVKYKVGRRNHWRNLTTVDAALPRDPILQRWVDEMNARNSMNRLTETTDTAGGELVVDHGSDEIESSSDDEPVLARTASAGDLDASTLDTSSEVLLEQDDRERADAGAVVAQSFFEPLHGLPACDENSNLYGDHSYASDLPLAQTLECRRVKFESSRKNESLLALAASEGDPRARILVTAPGRLLAYDHLGRADAAGSSSPPNSDTPIQDRNFKIFEDHSYACNSFRAQTSEWRRVEFESSCKNEPSSLLPPSEIPRDDENSNFLKDHSYASAGFPSNLRNLCWLQVENSNPQIPAMSNQMGRVIREALGKEADVVLVRTDNLSVRRSDLETLRNQNWLNDTIMNAYLNLISKRSKIHEGLPKVHVMNTFFLLCLEKGYDNVRGWTGTADIFAQDILLVPVYRDFHWCMAIIHVRKRLIVYADSLGGRNDECFRALIDYLSQEMASKHKRELVQNEWNFKYVDHLPKQANGSDCGVFALKFADYAARNSRVNFSQRDMAYFRQRITYEILQEAILPTGYGENY